MKQLYLILFGCFIFSFSIAQDYQFNGYHWQGKFRKDDQLLTNQKLNVTFTVLEDMDDCDGEGNLVARYKENHIDQLTNRFGLLNLFLGEGQLLEGDWNEIQWGHDCHYLKIEADVNGELVDLGQAKIVDVPAALGTPFRDYRWYAGQNFLLEPYLDRAGEFSFDFPDSDGEKRWSVWRSLSPTSGEHILTVRNNGNVGIRFTHPKAPLQINVKNDEDARLNGGGGIILGKLSDVNMAIDQNEIMVRENGKAGAMYIQADGGDLFVQRSNFVFKDNGRLGIGIGNPSKALHIHSAPGNGLRMTSPSKNSIISLHIADSDYGYLALGGNTKIRGNGRTSVFDGRVEVDVLRINGADIIEKAHSKQDLHAGEVVILDNIDENHVQRSYQAYQKTAIGVVSGAGGIKYAVELNQEGVLDGDIPVAIAGRVKVKVTGKVEAGDLLTTSNVAGHAMRAKNRKKSFGAIIGKALSEPDEEGLVLMLVGLQ